LRPPPRCGAGRQHIHGSTGPEEKGIHGSRGRTGIFPERRREEGRGRRRARDGGSRPGEAPSAPPGSEPITPDRAFYADALQEHLEEEYGGLGAYGDPLDSEEASEEDIAAELSRSREIAQRMEQGELSIEIEPIDEERALEQEARAVMELEENEEWNLSPPAADAAGEAPAEEKRERPARRGRGRGRRGRGRARGEAAAPAETEAAPTGAEEEEAEVTEEAEPASGARVAALWERLSSDSAFPLEELERQETGEGYLPQYLYATGKTKEETLAAPWPRPTSTLRSSCTAFAMSPSSRPADGTKHRFAPFFTDDARKAAYSSIETAAPALIGHPQTGVRCAYAPGAANRGPRGEPQLRGTARRISAPKMRRFLSPFKLPPSALVARRREGRVRGGKIYFRVRGTDVLMARPREGGLQVEVLHPRGRAFRLTEENFGRSEGPEGSARASAGLAQRER
jgi:hypothetical protein